MASLSPVWDGRIFHDPHQKVKVAFVGAGGPDALIELVEPVGQDSPVFRFLQQKGGGLHHLCYEVDDLESRMAEMRLSGALVARRPRPAVAFQGRRIGWMLTAAGLPVELLEKQPDSTAP